MVWSLLRDFKNAEYDSTNTSDYAALNENAALLKKQINSSRQ